MPNSRLKQSCEVIFSEEANSVIEEIIKKYDLGPVDFFEKEVTQRLEQAKTFEEKKEIAKSFPIVQITEIIKETAQGKILAKDLASTLQQRLDISQEKAKKIAEELEKKVLVLARKVPVERENVLLPKKPLVKPPPLRTETLEKKPTKTKPEIKPEAPPEKPNISRKPDIYREPIK
jgi:hypothetical protein